MTVGSLLDTWGSTPAERARPYRCDEVVDRPELTLFRAVDVLAPADLMSRWLCQLRVAPYSYDWIDNGGRRSPRELTPGLEHLEVGQRFARIFRLVEVEPGRSITIESTTAMFGHVAVTYVVLPVAADRCRLVAKLVVRVPRGPYGLVLRMLLPAGDLVMMRKELVTLQRLAERDAKRCR